MFLHNRQTILTVKVVRSGFVEKQLQLYKCNISAVYHVIVFTHFVPVSACLPGWAADGAGNCYKLVYSANAVNACTCSLRNVCWDYDSELVSIESETDQNFLFLIMNTMFSDPVVCILLMENKWNQMKIKPSKHIM
jgi:hypothetical protein